MITEVNICGIPHEVKYVDDIFNSDSFHFGQIEYGDAKISINNSLKPELKYETLCHEMLHGMLVHLGYSELSDNEQLVQALGNAIAQSFNIRPTQCEL